MIVSIATVFCLAYPFPISICIIMGLVNHVRFLFHIPNPNSISNVFRFGSEVCVQVTTWHALSTCSICPITTRLRLGLGFVVVLGQKLELEFGSMVS